MWSSVELRFQPKVDLVKRHCPSPVQATVWNLHVTGAETEFTCVHCGLPPDPRFEDMARDLFYSPAPLARVKIGPVEADGGSHYPYYESPEPTGVAVRPEDDPYRAAVRTLREQCDREESADPYIRARGPLLRTSEIRAILRHCPEGDRP